MSGLLINPYRFAAGGGGGGTPDSYGIDAIASPAEVADRDFESGYKFTVGASDIEVVALRAYQDTAVTGVEVKLWRASDETVIANATFDLAGGGVWTEEAITAVTLSSGSDYVVSTYRTGTYPAAYEETADITFNSAITSTEGRKIAGPSGQGFADTAYGFPTLADIGFTIP